MTIRTAQSGDACAIVELVTQVLRDEFPRDQGAYSTEDLEQLGETYLKPACTFLVAEEAGRIIGTCGVKSEGSRSAVLRRLFVDARHRSRGVGTALVEGALDFCRGQRFREVVIRASTRMEEAIRLCRSLGFEEEGRWTLGDVTLVRYRLELS